MTAAELSAWRDAFVAAGEASLKTRPADSRDVEIGRLEAEVGDLTMAERNGIHAARRATRFEALEPIRQDVRARLGAFAEGVSAGLELRHDHGSQSIAVDFQREFAFLGIGPAPAFVREPKGNGCAERFIRTLKENLLWVRRFDNIEDLHLALHTFKDTYNRTWTVERHGYQTPRGRQSGAARDARRRSMKPATRCLSTVDRYTMQLPHCPRREPSLYGLLDCNARTDIGA